MRKLWTVLKVLVSILIVYVAAMLIYGTLTDWTPEKYLVVEATENGQTPVTIQDSVLSFLIWNVGYGGLGKEEAFFYDQGDFFWTEMGRARVPRDRVEDYVAGQKTTINSIAADFYLLQEIDLDSRRSWYINQLGILQKELPAYAAAYAENYHNERVPIPIFQPWDHYGYVRSGLASLTAYQPEISERYQLPGDLDWPTRLFELDRCVLRQSFKTDWGKELIVYNIHLAAYDKGGVVKKQQMEWLRDAMIADYEKGHYVVVGGDWNQVPPGFDYAIFSPERRNEFTQIDIDFEYAPPGWVFAYDPEIPTNRKTNEVYNAKKSRKSLIDFYLVSPNVKLKKVKGIDQGFEYSDHQPVYLEVELE